eukprot:265264-Rhodomonas_salina.1
MSGTDEGYAATHLLCNAQYWPKLCCSTVSGTDLRYAATSNSQRAQGERSSASRLVNCAVKSNAIKHKPRTVRTKTAVFEFDFAGGGGVVKSLRAPYAISSTDMVYGAISLRTPCAVSGTDA